ncbi:MAG: SdpI family protein [Gemmatimonadaceae bacterium]|nr:SdpI family protein [Gemmatimonadaceae bacterium]
MMHRILQPLLVVAAAALSLFAWARVPERAPVHWNLAGAVDRYGARAEVLLLMPAMMIVIWALLRFLPRIDPRRESYAKMEGTYELVITLMLGVLLALHGAVIAAALGRQVPMGRIAPALLGATFLVLGNVLPRARPNWWFGIRTPWTLSNDRVWTRTHRVAGYAFIIAGLGLIIAAFSGGVAVKGALLAGGLVAALVPAAYSYIAWRQETSA